MKLNVFVDTDDKELIQLYKNAAISHNAKLFNEPHFYDAGFDLFLPSDFKFSKQAINKIDFKVKCCAQMYKLSSDNDAHVNINRYTYMPFYTYARSSISKTPLRLANNQGIIDAGYRGNLIGMFDCLEEDYLSVGYSRILQVCAAGLVPIFVSIVTTSEELGPNTTRGEGGFGSTGV